MVTGDVLEQISSHYLKGICEGLFSWKNLLRRPEKIHHNFEAVFINLYFLEVKYIEFYES